MRSTCLIALLRSVAGVSARVRNGPTKDTRTIGAACKPHPALRATFSLTRSKGRSLRRRQFDASANGRNLSPTRAPPFPTKSTPAKKTAKICPPPPNLSDTTRIPRKGVLVASRAIQKREMRSSVKWSETARNVDKLECGPSGPHARRKARGPTYKRRASFRKTEARGKAA